MTKIGIFVTDHSNEIMYKVILAQTGVPIVKIPSMFITNIHRPQCLFSKELYSHNIMYAHVRV